MTGKNCVAIASDMRFGVQAQTLSFNFAKVFRMSEKVFLGLSGLATDIQTLYGASLSLHLSSVHHPLFPLASHIFSPPIFIMYGAYLFICIMHFDAPLPFFSLSSVPSHPLLAILPFPSSSSFLHWHPSLYSVSCTIKVGIIIHSLYRHQKLVFRTNLYKLREEREMSPRVFGNLVSTTLYEKRFGPYFSEPVIAGIYCSLILPNIYLTSSVCYLLHNFLLKSILPLSVYSVLRFAGTRAGRMVLVKISPSLVIKLGDGGYFNCFLFIF